MSGSKKYREKYPLKYAYQNLKDNAKRRGKDFNLTFKEFKEFATKVEYIKKKGIKGECFHIDRIDENKGYTKDNIQLLTNSQNVRKFLRHWWDGKEYVFRNEVSKPIKENSRVPF
jgi:hypothetical protein